MPASLTSDRSRPRHANARGPAADEGSRAAVELRSREGKPDDHSTGTSVKVSVPDSSDTSMQRLRLPLYRRISFV